jgi:DNA-binding CsgD family transcriptional regulator
MHEIDLNNYQSITLPKNKAELMRGLNAITQEMGCVRFAYVQLPESYELLKAGVLPKMLTNYPEIVTREYLKKAKEPFSFVVRSLRNREAVFFHDAILSEEVYFLLIGQEVGLIDGVIIPIEGVKNAAMAYAFESNVTNNWVANYNKSDMVQITKIIDMIIRANHLCDAFDIPGLTERTRRMLLLKAQGLTNAQVGDKLGVQPDTIKKALKRLGERLGGLSTIEIVYHLATMSII